MKMGSNASLFEQRGDAWVTPREGREKFGRNLESENPEADSHLFATRVKYSKRKEIAGVAIGKVKQASEKVDDKRVLANKLILLNRAINKGRKAKDVRQTIEEQRRRKALFE